MKKASFILLFFILIFTFAACSHSPTHTHTYTNETEIVREPTCIADGEGYRICTECGEKSDVFSIPKINHEESVISGTEPTCIESGRAAGSYCLTCGKPLISPKELPALGHLYENASCIRCNSYIGPVIVRPLTDAKAVMGEKYCVTAEAEGKELQYTWYIRNEGASDWTKSKVTGSTYSDIMTVERAGREVYCVITDAYGNSVATNTVSLVPLPKEPTVIWEQWLRPFRLSADTYPTYGGDSEGYYSKGQLFNGIIYSSTFREGNDVLWNLNHSTYYSAVANPASLLYTLDCRGRVPTESSWAGSVCSTTAMKACGYPFPYSTDEVREAFEEKKDQSIYNLQFGDILWRPGHVAAIIGVNIEENERVSSATIIEQSKFVKVFEISAENWESYFSDHWEKIYRGDFDEEQTRPVEYPENLSLIFERGNNTYVRIGDYDSMLFYIPTATTVYLTKDGVTESYKTKSFPTETVNGVTVYDLSSLFTGTGDYYFHSNENPTSMYIKIIDTGSISIDGNLVTFSGYSGNVKPYAYRVIKIIDEKKSNSYNFFGAPEGFTSNFVNHSFRKITCDSFEIENIPSDCEGWKLEIFYDTGCGWARVLSDNILYQ